jgi:hypothetical protein
MYNNRIDDQRSFFIQQFPTNTGRTKDVNISKNDLSSLDKILSTMIIKSDSTTTETPIITSDTIVTFPSILRP